MLPHLLLGQAACEDIIDLKHAVKLSRLRPKVVLLDRFERELVATSGVRQRLRRREDTVTAGLYPGDDLHALHVG
jgi:hypothetical protein